VTSKGYTLVELLTVIAILALMTTIASLYLFRRDGAFGLQIAARELAACLRQAHAKAISLNKPQAVILDLDAHRFACPGKAGQFPSASRILFRTAAAEYVRDRTASLRFLGDGTATGGNIFLEERGQMWAIRVNWLSGEVRLAREAHWPEP
jgi:general secretion pathway protein H